MENDIVPEENSEQKGGRTAWMAHVKKTMRANKGKSLKQVLKMAGKTYKKSGKTARKTRKGKSKKFLGMFGGAGGMGPSTTEGAADVSGSMEGGRRRRRH